MWDHHLRHSVFEQISSFYSWRYFYFFKQIKIDQDTAWDRNLQHRLHFFALQVAVPKIEMSLWFLCCCSVPSRAWHGPSRAYTMFGSWFTSTNSAQVVSTELGCNNNINSDSQQSQHNATDKSCDRMKRLRLKNNEYDKQKRSQSKVMHKSLQTENSELKYEIIRLRKRCSEQ